MFAEIKDLERSPYSVYLLVYHSSHICKKKHNMQTDTSSEIPRTYELHIKPTYAVVIPQHVRSGRPKSDDQIKNEKNLKDNATKGAVSKKASKRLCNAINWLVASAKTKHVYDAKTKRSFNFKINFVTLTLPTVNHGITDHAFKSVLLHNFINTCRSKFEMKNFVWKVETQENGNIHAHVTTDVFIHWRELQKVWNKILLRNGLIDSYRDKHSAMSFGEYCKAYNADGKKSEASLLKSFENGVATNWEQPNSTDVHSVKNVKDLGAYLAKYLCKNDITRRRIVGRVWSCSYNLSDSNKLIIEMNHAKDFEYLAPLHQQGIKYQQITHLKKATNQIFNVGEIFFYSLKDWGVRLTGKLWTAFNSHCMNIRSGIDMAALRALLVPPPPTPECFDWEFENMAFSVPFSAQTHCPF